MTKSNKPTMEIDLTANWKKFIRKAPDGSQPIGVITLDGVSGALIRCQSKRPGSFAYMQIVSKSSDPVLLDGRVISGLLGLSGRKKQLPEGDKYWIYLSLENVKTARRLGMVFNEKKNIYEENMSLGIRRALDRCKNE